MNTPKEPGVCRLCDRRQACRTWELSSKACEQLDDIAEHSDILPAGHRLWGFHEPIRALHIVRSGSFKCSRTYSDDHERVLGFTFPTELLGIDGLYVGLHQSSAVALEDSRICSFNLSKLTPLMNQNADLRALVARLIGNTQRHQESGDDRSPEQRVAGFLMNLSQRAFRRGDPAADFDLPMSPVELGSYLQIPAETVSAVLVHLARHHQIDLDSGHVRLLKPEVLQVLASA